jgi:hypothetical protein
VTLPPPAVLAKKGTGRAGKTMLLRYLALADGTGVSASATVTSGKRVVFTRTTAARTLTNGQSYNVPWHPARTQRGSFRFCVRSVAVDGTQSSQSCAAVTVR